MRRACQFCEHLNDSHCIIAGVEAAGGLGDAAETNDVEDGGAFVGAALGNYEVTAAVGWGSAPCAFCNVEDDADGSPFELITKRG